MRAHPIERIHNTYSRLFAGTSYSESLPATFFDGSLHTDFENHLASMNMDPKDYSIFGASLQIVLS